MFEDVSISDDRPMWDIWLSVHYLPAVTVADELGVFDALADASLDGDALADRVTANVRSLDILMGLLGGLNLVEKRDGRWIASSVARKYLHSQSEFYWGDLLARFRDSLPAHARLLEKVRRGANEGALEDSFKGWKSGDLPPDVALRSAKLMHAHSTTSARAAARAIDGSAHRALLDVGGGSGVFSASFARAWPDLRVAMMDLKAMCDAAKNFIDTGSAGSRVETIACDMFRDPWPADFDAIFMSNIFHDWDDATCVELAHKAFTALPPGGKIYLHEMLMNDNGDGPATTASFAVLMLMGNAGRQYTFPQIKAFLSGAGFVDVSSQPASGYYSIVQATKPVP